MIRDREKRIKTAIREVTDVLCRHTDPKSDNLAQDVGWILSGGYSMFFHDAMRRSELARLPNKMEIGWEIGWHVGKKAKRTPRKLKPRS